MRIAIYVTALMSIQYLAGCDCQKEINDRLSSADTELVVRQILKQSTKSVQAWGLCKESKFPQSMKDCLNMSDDEVKSRTGLVCVPTKVQKEISKPQDQTIISNTSVSFEVKGIITGSVSGSVTKRWGQLCSFFVKHNHDQPPAQGTGELRDPEIALRDLWAGDLTLLLNAAASGTVTIIKSLKNPGSPETVSVGANAECTFYAGEFVGCDYFQDGRKCSEDNSGQVVWVDPAPPNNYVRTGGATGWQESPDGGAWTPVPPPTATPTPPSSTPGGWGGTTCPEGNTPCQKCLAGQACCPKMSAVSDFVPALFKCLQQAADRQARVSCWEQFTDNATPGPKQDLRICAVNNCYDDCFGQ